MSTSSATDCTTQSVIIGEVLPAHENHHPRGFEGNSAGKRKYGQMDESSETWQPFNIQAAQPSSGDQHQPLIPRFLLPRSCLPLAYLDPTADGGASCGSRLFAARIKTLDLDDDEAQQSQPSVLIAQSKSCGRFYAVERVHNGIYALCRLGIWVAEDTLDKLRDAGSTPDPPFQGKYRKEAELLGNEWWRSAMAPSHLGSHDPIKNIDAIVRAREFKLSLKKPLTKDIPPVLVRGITPAPNPMEKPLIGRNDVVDDRVQKPEDTLKIIKSQYQDALYVSRASLAYFAKGPLSRARASFQHQDGSTYDVWKFTQQLRTMILPLPLMDKKYRETLPALVKEYPFSTLSGGESASVIQTVKKRSRKSKKDKVGKDGLYAGEDISIAQWWLGRDTSDSVCDTDDAREESLKTTILEQRAREAQLQMIILLETLALEANRVVPGENPARAECVGHEHDQATTQAKKPKKPQDLHTLLDLLADRLCIWQSMSAEVEKPLANEQRQLSDYLKKAQDTTNDQLRHFCINVVIPFYGARLPEVSALLCQKLGGPEDPSPKRPPPLSLKAISKVSTKPGAPIPRPQSRKPRRTLERVLTDDRSCHKRQTPSLSRSATEPVLQVKREVNDTTLSSIPLNKVTMSKRYTQREVDLRAASQTTETRHKKKIAVQQELQGAIAAIKKPNPQVAGREFVETVEKRQASSKSRKPKNPTRHQFAHGLQVMATPSRNKHAVPYKLPALPQPQDVTMSFDAYEIPPFSVSRIVPTSTRKFQGPASSGDTDDNQIDRRSFAFVDQTPTRGSAKLIHRSCVSTEENAVVESSQTRQTTSFLKPPNEPYRLPGWKSNAQETPSKGMNQIWQTAPDIQAKSCKQSPTDTTTFNALSPSSQPEEPDFYANLGWNYEVND